MRPFDWIHAINIHRIISTQTKDLTYSDVPSNRALCFQTGSPLADIFRRPGHTKVPMLDRLEEAYYFLNGEDYFPLRGGKRRSRLRDDSVPPAG